MAAPVMISGLVLLAAVLATMILLAYLFIDAGGHARYTWLRRGVWATAFAAVCLWMLWARPLLQ